MKYLLLCILLIGCKDEFLDTPINLFSKQILNEINFVRTHPQEYAELRLAQENNNGSYLYLKSLSSTVPVTLNDALNKMANHYVNILKDSLSHYLEGSLMLRAIDAGYDGTIVGENIAASTSDVFNAFITPEEAAIEFVRILIVDEGVEDLGHRKLILNSKYKVMGFAYKRDLSGKYKNYLVQIFGNY